MFGNSPSSHQRVCYPKEETMSKHKSLKSNKFGEIKSVRTRRERVAKLIRNLKWAEGMSVYGLPKEVILRLKYKIKKEEKPKEVIPPYEAIVDKKKKKTSRDDKETNRR